MPTFHELFHRYLAPSLDKQLLLNDLVQDWPQTSGDLQAGRFSFTQNPNADDLQFSVQVLGSEGRDDRWLWIWANQQSSFPSQVTEAAEWVREFGQEHNIPEFTTPGFSIEYDRPGNFLTGSALAGTVCCMLDAFAYLPLPMAGANAFVLLKNDVINDDVENPAARICNVFPMLLNDNWVVPDLKLAFQGYLEFYGFESHWDGDTVEAAHPSGIVNASFDEAGRLTDLAARVPGPV